MPPLFPCLLPTWLIAAAPPPLYTHKLLEQVASDRKSSMLVAQTYMHLVMGIPLDCPLGMRTIARRRRCQQQQAGADPTAAEEAARAGVGPSSAADSNEIAAAGSPERPSCGLATHAGKRSSAFDAAVCALVRAREQQPGGDSAEAAGSGVADDQAAAADPGSPVAAAPTPSIPAPPAAAPGLQPMARVRHHHQLGIPKRVGSRRTLFDMVTADGGDDNGGDGVGSRQHCSGEGGSSRLGGKSPRQSASLGSRQQHQQEEQRREPAAAAAAGAAAGVVVGSVTLEQLMSPSHASLHGLAAQQAAAAQPPPAALESRKRLRFE